MNKNEPLGLNEYQTLANVTKNKDISYDQALTNYALGLTGEAGEVADIIKKHVFHGHTLDKEELIKELGDVMWYLATLASTLDVTIEEIACRNVAKLQRRYPEGFSKNMSINRMDTKSVNGIRNTASNTTAGNSMTNTNININTQVDIDDIADVIRRSMTTKRTNRVE